ncbi:MAG: hypothetical protein JNN06_08875 [Gemmobacter sp.]|uniref:DUF2946 family protein n=1 Tax=Gemmobacter sp. TaxID=1898957 RepID=UPI001A483CA6|nr:DUF2946 family protein [Gemmobacter sp.]MBL8562380.1 hypothetical protein [Gemmobacter sp.]
MSARRLCHHSLLRAIGLWLVVPFVLLSLVAKGYMPVQAADGGLTMVICSGAGAVSITIDPETGASVPHEAPEDGRCSWAQMGAAAVLPEAAPLVVPVVLPRAVVPASPDDLWRPAFDPRGLFARGPPATV